MERKAPWSEMNGFLRISIKNSWSRARDQNIQW